MRKITGYIKHLFYPHPENNFRARILHHDLLTVYLALVLVFVFATKNAGVKNVLGYATDINKGKLLEFTNQVRKDHNLSSLTYNSKLEQAAARKAEDMLKKNYWAHYAPDGKSPWNFMYEVDYEYEYAGENLAKNFSFSKNVVEAWMESPSHRENILRKEYTEIGFAIVDGVLNGEQTTLVVQMFGKPLGKDTTSPIAAPPVEAAPIENLAGVQATNSVSSTNTPLNIYWFFAGFLSLALIADMYFAYRLKIVRFHSKNFAHLLFIIFLSAGIILFITKGVIL